MLDERGCWAGCIHRGAGRPSCLLLALDFCGAALVASQPFRLSFMVFGERREHRPDVLAVLPDGSTWVRCAPENSG